MSCSIAAVWPANDFAVRAPPVARVPGSPSRAVVVSSSLEGFGGGIMGLELNDASSGGGVFETVSQPAAQKEYAIGTAKMPMTKKARKPSEQDRSRTQRDAGPR